MGCVALDVGLVGGFIPPVSIFILETMYITMDYHWIFKIVIQYVTSIYIIHIYIFIHGSRYIRSLPLD